MKYELTDRWKAKTQEGTTYEWVTIRLYGSTSAYVGNREYDAAACVPQEELSEDIKQAIALLRLVGEGRAVKGVGLYKKKLEGFEEFWIFRT